MEQLNRYLLPYLISNLVFCCGLVCAFKKPFWLRSFLILLFAWASLTNLFTALNSPRVYLEYARLSFLDIYRTIILGLFSHHIQLFIILIAVCQFLICLGFISGSKWMVIAGWAAILFGVAIAPFGVGSAFPSTILMAASVFILLRKYQHMPIWIIHQYQKTQAI